MDIHVIQQGETIISIAERYGVPVERLIEYNGLPNPYDLVIGQCIVIVYPEITYTVQEGDTLGGIATAYNTSIIQLLRNNPFLSDREFMYPGETLVISFGEKKGSILTNGYANPFIRRDILRKTLPFLTYLTIFGYQATENADIIEPDDEQLISMAKEYQVAPIMLLSTLTFQGVGSVEAVYNILYNENKVDKFIENIINTLRRKGFYGVNFIYSYLTNENEEVYNSFTEKVADHLNREGFAVFVSISPMTVIETNVITFEKINYSQIGRYANQIVVMNYNWGYNFGPPRPAASIYEMQLFLDYLVTLIPFEKIIAGIPLLGYSWQLPYLIGETRASSLTYDAAITLAKETGAEIQFDEVSQNPYYEFFAESSGVPRKYIVWFVDVRSIEALLGLEDEYNIHSFGIWNIMTYFSQMWLVINTQYEIETIIT